MATKHEHEQWQVQTLLARHFDIDQVALENEKRAMLEKMRQQ